MKLEETYLCYKTFSSLASTALLFRDKYIDKHIANMTLAIRFPLCGSVTTKKRSFALRKSIDVAISPVYSMIIYSSPELGKNFAVAQRDGMESRGFLGEFFAK